MIHKKHRSRHFHRLAGSALLVTLIGTWPSNGPAIADTSERRHALARTVPTGECHIDGTLDERCWENADWQSDFLLEYPVEGGTPSQATSFAVLYDDENLYVGIRAFDSSPSDIRGHLLRKDDWVGLSQDDYVVIVLDCYHDYQSGFQFIVNPRGAMGDAISFEDIKTNVDWEGVWRAATSIDSAGWQAEIEIPLTTLRYPQASCLQWGFNVTRAISRTKETANWQFLGRSDYGFISRLGYLDSICVGTSAKNLEVSLVGLTRVDYLPPQSPDKRASAFDAGIDLDYAFRSNVRLLASINPDFGQVEQDPAILNLTAYETYFPEKRPFFLEGAEIFETPFQLFYSRRIGRTPQRFTLGEVDSICEYPDVTTVLEATKIAGKSRSGMTFGLLQSLTGQERADVITDGETSSPVVEPRTNYITCRLKRDILSGGSSVGLIATSVNRWNAESALAGGIDWNLLFHQNSWSVSGQAAGSRSGPAGDRKSGHGLTVRFGREGGRYLRSSLSLEEVSKRFEINDAGFLKRNDYRQVGFSMTLLYNDHPLGPVRYVNNQIATIFAWNRAGLPISKRLQNTTMLTLTNYYTVTAGGFGTFPFYDDLTTGGGPTLLVPSSTGFWAAFGTDSRRAFFVELDAGANRSTSGSWGNTVGLQLEYKTSRVTAFAAKVSYTNQYTDAQWLGNLDFDGDGVAESSLFGELRQRTLDCSMRSDVVLSPQFSIQLYAQPYLVLGDYQQLKLLQQPQEYEFTNVDFGFEPDFTWGSLRVNLVIRWEFQEGSTLYFALGHDRDDYITPSNYGFHEVVSSLTDAKGSSVVTGKATYRLLF